jgi:hypothetical protein
MAMERSRYGTGRGGLFPPPILRKDYADVLDPFPWFYTAECDEPQVRHEHRCELLPQLLSNSWGNGRSFEFLARKGMWAMVGGKRRGSDAFGLLIFPKF